MKGGGRQDRTHRIYLKNKNTWEAKMFKEKWLEMKIVNKISVSLCVVAIICGVLIDDATAAKLKLKFNMINNPYSETKKADLNWR